MAEYKIFFKHSAVKQLHAKWPAFALPVIKRIDSLKKDPRPPGCEKLTGQERYRIRQENYRIIYSIQDLELTIWVVKVGHRRDIYR